MDEMELEYRAQDLDEAIEGELVIAPNGTAAVRQLPMQQVKTQYVTAMAVQEPRSLKRIEKKLYEEASLLGDSAFYAWTVKDRKTGKTTVISGDSIGLAMAAIRCFGNCVLDQDPPVETKDAWFFTVHVIDLERGFTHTRTGRYSRLATVYGDQDVERKERIRYEIGQSIAIRNAIDDVVPKWLMDGAIKAAKSGVRKELEGYITKQGMPKTRQILIDRLVVKGITQERILDKMQRPTIEALTLDDLVIMQADAKQLADNAEVAENLYPEVDIRQPAPGTVEGSPGQQEPPKSRVEEVKQQLSQRRTKADRSQRPAAPVYATKEQTDELQELANARGPGAIRAVSDIFRGDPEKVTVAQFEAAKAHLLTQPVLTPGEGNDPVYIDPRKLSDLLDIASERGVPEKYAALFEHLWTTPQPQLTEEQYQVVRNELLARPPLVKDESGESDG